VAHIGLSCTTGISAPEFELAQICSPRFKLLIAEGAYALIKQRSSIMWTRDDFVSYSFLLAVTATGVGLLATLVFG
jgi:hypothetical protein